MKWSHSDFWRNRIHNIATMYVGLSISKSTGNFYLERSSTTNIWYQILPFSPYKREISLSLCLGEFLVCDRKYTGTASVPLTLDLFSLVIFLISYLFSRKHTGVDVVATSFVFKGCWKMVPLHIMQKLHTVHSHSYKTISYNYKTLFCTKLYQYDIQTNVILCKIVLYDNHSHSAQRLKLCSWYQIEYCTFLPQRSCYAQPSYMNSVSCWCS